MCLLRAYARTLEADTLVSSYPIFANTWLARRIALSGAAIQTRFTWRETLCGGSGRYLQQRLDQALSVALDGVAV